MSWLDERISQDNARKERIKLIEDEAFKIYDVLWREVFKDIEEAQRKGFEILTNGSEIERVVRLSVAPGPNETSRSPKEICFHLNEDKLAIRVSGEVSLTFVLDVCPDGVVCLKENGNQISAENAAKLILDNFLFPHLQKPTA